MSKKGLFIGFLSENETQKNNKIDEIPPLLVEQERRTRRREIALFVAGIVITAIVDIALHLLGH